MEEIQKTELAEEIRTLIRKAPEGCISFYEYMELCLYHPELGYYCSDKQKIGIEGDFYTASDVGGIMATVIAGYYASVVERNPSLGVLAEWGGGTGKMAKTILDTLKESYPLVYERMIYEVIEKSPYHRTLQQSELKEHMAHVLFLSEEQWIDKGSSRGVFVLAQELLDAFPVHRVRQKDGELLEIFVSWDDIRGNFREVTRPCTHEAVLAYLDREAIHLQEGQTAEVNLQADEWIKKRLSQMRAGCLLTIDYGDQAEEIYAPHRMEGTLMCYYRHRAHDDPFFLPGQQDLTTHVNFSACIRVGEQSGAEKTKLWSQRDFLVEHGALDLLSNHSDTDPFSPLARKNRAIRQLLWGDRMGDLFKVLLQYKGIQT